MGLVSDAIRRAGGGIAGAGVEDRALDVFALEDGAPASTSVIEPARARTVDAALAAVSMTTPIDAGGSPVVAPAAEPLPHFTPLVEEPHLRAPEKAVIGDSMTPGCREQYRRLAAALHHGQLATGLKVVMVSSAVASEGKTLTASNLALTLSESYQQSVLLIDADFRRPSLHTFFGIDGTFGLMDMLSAAEERPAVVRRISAMLSVLPAGRPSSDPMAGLTSPRMKQLIAHARETFTWVIIDTPPVGLLTDANLLASMVDGTLLVVKAGETPYQLTQRAVEAIGVDRFLGVVLNQATEHAKAYGYYADYYAYGKPRPEPKA
jgi:receptor protein-tyrosine kinase